MKRRRSALLVSLALFICVGLSVGSSVAADARETLSVPSPRGQLPECAAPLIMLDQGWWLKVAAGDFPVTIGYGALPEMLPIKTRAIEVTEICALIEEHVRPWQPKGARSADDHFFDVVFGTGGGVVFDLDEEIYPQLYELFRRAFGNVDEDRGPLFGDADTVERVWREAFFITGQ
jgi:hypothetical protein